MKLHYYPETDTLYIDFRDEPAAETEEIAYDVLVDYNAQRQVVGLTIDDASTKIDLATVEVNELPNVLVHASTSARAVQPEAAHARSIGAGGTGGRSPGAAVLTAEPVADEPR